MSLRSYDFGVLFISRTVRELIEQGGFYDRSRNFRPCSLAL